MTAVAELESWRARKALRKCRILQVPKHEQFLREVARPLTDAEIKSSELLHLSESMIHTIRKNGVGLAGPQVGYGIRFFVVNDHFANDLDPGVAAEEGRWDIGLRAIANPVLLKVNRGKRVRFERCLSIPGKAFLVIRHLAVTLEWTDLDGDRGTEHLVGFAARIVQHEVDHLDGKLISDRVLKTNRYPEGVAISDHEYDNRWKNAKQDEIVEHFMK